MFLNNLLPGVASCRNITESCRPVNGAVSLSNDDILLIPSEDGVNRGILVVTDPYTTRLSISSKFRVQLEGFNVDVQGFCMVNWTISVKTNNFTAVMTSEIRVQVPSGSADTTVKEVLFTAEQQRAWFEWQNSTLDAANYHIDIDVSVEPDKICLVRQVNYQRPRRGISIRTRGLFSINIHHLY